MLEHTNIDFKLIEIRAIKMLFDLHNHMVDNSINSLFINLNELEKHGLTEKEEIIEYKRMVMAMARNKFSIKLEPLNFNNVTFDFKASLI